LGRPKSGGGAARPPGAAWINQLPTRADVASFLEAERNQIRILGVGALLILVVALAWRSRPPDLLDQPCPPTRLGATGYLQRDGVAELWGVANQLDRDRETLRGFGRLVTAILVARVRAIDPGEWNLAGQPDAFNPEDPPGTSPRWYAQGRYIYTDIELDVERYVKGTGPTAPRYRVEGGRAGDWQMVVGYEPEFQPGERVLLLLRKDFRAYEGRLDREHVVGFGPRGKFTLDGDTAIDCGGRSVPLADLERTLLELTR
jgi:hypothetical protein